MSEFSSQLMLMAEISSSFDNMSQAMKVDLTIVEKLDKLLEYIKLNESKYKNSNEIDNKTAFALFHAWRNLRLVLSKMKKRIIDSIPMHDNPKVVDDSIALWPSVVTTFTNINRFEKGILPYDNRSQIYEVVRRLRSSAQNVGMLPSPEEEIKELDRKKLRKDLGILMAEVYITNDEEHCNT